MATAPAPLSRVPGVERRPCSSRAPEKSKHKIIAKSEINAARAAASRAARRRCERRRELAAAARRADGDKAAGSRRAAATRAPKASRRGARAKARSARPDRTPARALSCDRRCSSGTVPSSGSSCRRAGAAERMRFRDELAIKYPAVCDAAVIGAPPKEQTPPPASTRPTSARADRRRRWRWEGEPRPRRAGYAPRALGVRRRMWLGERHRDGAAAPLGARGERASDAAVQGPPRHLWPTPRALRAHRAVDGYNHPIAVARARRHRAILCLLARDVVTWLTRRACGRPTCFTGARHQRTSTIVLCRHLDGRAPTEDS